MIPVSMPDSPENHFSDQDNTVQTEPVYSAVLGNPNLNELTKEKILNAQRMKTYVE